MTALYALPDHEVILSLIPQIGDDLLGTEAAIARIHATPGLVPVAIDPAGGTKGRGRVFWADLGDHPFREWQFMFTIRHLVESGAIGEAFSTDIDILQDDRILADPIEPTGFIFHISRCGSTLTAKALARSPRHVVINQGGPLQRGFWAAMTRDWQDQLQASPENLKAFRNLVLALTRRRRAGQDRAFVKFISWNTLYMDFAMAAFPEVPAVFLYRDTVEVIASVFRDTTAILWAKGKRQAGFLAGMDWQETKAMDDVTYLARCFDRYLQQAGQPARPLSLVNYRQISPDSFATILQEGLGFKPDETELAEMLEQFRFHSKDDSNQTEFQEDSVEKRASMSEEDKWRVREICGESLAKLDASAANLFCPAGSIV